ncbi:conserved hypothetical protein [Psychromonas ingrahamii 37]|uniref:DUF4202 domain-containing protein n=1 Tax=Psychromonas ingrahamii (strain DSM 17664 / CCUG 51855 / 37) TaxID=357804 RepID=A1SSM2_PSYIN|nr:DUF4202 domain-containing protein [Psychromonas ingrahamii]ABM02487.1 conserved hypothetical protein [Psychromonas ingrahamii 37]
MSQQIFEQVISLIDAVNGEDPNRESAENKEWPKEYLYSQRMSEMLARFKPDADDLLKIAVHGQHIQRWKSPRSDYPTGKQGYHQWRTNLYTFHAESVASLMVQAGYDDTALERVKNAVSKKSIKINPDSQLVEDIASLVFIEHYMLAFAEKHPEYSQEKWIGMISKTWKKMSNDGHQFVLAGNIKLPAPLLELIHQSIG